MEEHFKKLENMYLNAAVQKVYKGIHLKVEEGSAFVTWKVSEAFFHAGGSLHGSVYFRMMDDSAYFAVNSLVLDEFMLTSSFQIDFLRPVQGGTLRAEGKVVSKGSSVFLAKSDLYDERGKLVATGKGTFMKSGKALNSINGYA